MNFSIAAIISRLLAPRHELSCSWPTWRRLLRDLRDRGRGVRESGAFLLGRIDKRGHRRIVEYLLYDDLDPHALDTGIIHLDGSHFGKLWDLCSQRSLMVVADVHTHPGASQQSQSDRAHPIIARAGHIALIVPNFAAAPVDLSAVGIHRYGGGGRWQAIPARQRRQFFFIGF